MLAGNGTSSPVQQAPAPQAAGQSDASALKAESSAVTKDLAEKTAPAVAAQWAACAAIDVYLHF